MSWARIKVLRDPEDPSRRLVRRTECGPHNGPIVRERYRAPVEEVPALVARLRMQPSAESGILVQPGTDAYDDVSVIYQEGIDA